MRIERGAGAGGCGCDRLRRYKTARIQTSRPTRPTPPTRPIPPARTLNQEELGLGSRRSCVLASDVSGGSRVSSGPRVFDLINTSSQTHSRSGSGSESWTTTRTRPCRPWGKGKIGDRWVSTGLAVDFRGRGLDPEVDVNLDREQEQELDLGRDADVDRVRVRGDGRTVLGENRRNEDEEEGCGSGSRSDRSGGALLEGIEDRGGLELEDGRPGSAGPPPQPPLPQPHEPNPDHLRNTRPRPRPNRYPSNHTQRPIQQYRSVQLKQLSSLWAEYRRLCSFDTSKTVSPTSTLSSDHPAPLPTPTSSSPNPNSKQSVRTRLKYLVGRVGRSRWGGKEMEREVDESVVRGWEEVGGYYLLPGGEGGDGLDGLFRLISGRLRRVGVDERLIQPFLVGGEDHHSSDINPCLRPPPSIPRFHTLSIPLPSFLIAQITSTKIKDHPTLLGWTKLLSHLIHLGAWDSGEQGEIWSALTRCQARWGDEAGLRVVGKRFGEVVVRTRGGGEEMMERDVCEGSLKPVFGVRSVGRVEGFRSMGLTLTTILMASSSPSPSPLHSDPTVAPPTDPRRRANRMKEVARRLMGRLTRRMVELGSTEWDPAWIGLFVDSRVIGSDARDQITRWVRERRRSRTTRDEAGVEDEVDLRRFTLTKLEVDRWLAHDVKSELFLPDPILLPGETEPRLVFRHHAQLVQMDRGEMPLSISEALFKSALRDGEDERARQLFKASNRLALREAGSRNRIASLARAMAMANLAGNTQIMRQVVDAIEDVVRTGGAESTNPTRDPQQLGRMRSLAWTRLLAGYHGEAGVSNRDWLGLCAHLPIEMRSDPSVLTTLMKCYMARQMPDLAWQCWQDLIEMKRIDAAAITLAATFKYNEAGIEAAMAFVDDWTGSPVDRAPIDVITVNVLLRLAGNARRADLATWLWQNMRERWRVQPDATSLAYLIDCVSRAGSHTGRPALQANWAQNSSRPRPTSPRQTTSDRFHVGAPLEWQDVAEIFRSTAMTFHPSLAHIISPMEEGRVMGAVKELVTSGHLPYAETVHPPGPDNPSHPFPEARIDSNVSLSALNFETYIRMLLHQQLYDDAVLALGWMKHLSIYPNRNTLLVVLRNLADSGQPKDLRFLKEKTGWSRCQLMAPDEWLRHWLEMWLGPKRTPTDDQVAQSVRRRLSELSR